MKEMKNLLKKVNSDMLVYIILSVMTILYVLSKLLSRQCSMKILLLICFVTFLFIIGSYFLLKKSETKKIENVFLCFSIIFGIFYIFGFPPSQLPDDTPDYLRALEVSKGQLTTPQKGSKVGRNLSTNIGKVYKSEKYSDVIKNSNLKLNDKKIFYSYANKSLYAFVCYIPQAIGVGIGRILNMPIVVQIILGKIFNYILYVLLIYLSLKYIPVKKELLFFISLLPMSLQEATSLAPDAMIICCLIALVSFIIYQRETKEATMSKKNMILLGILSIVISLCKIVYLPLIFLIFLIPNEKFSSKKQKKIYCMVICAISIILNLYWLSLSSSYLVAFHNRSNSSLQLKYILTNPIKYIIILYKTIDYYTLIYLEELVGCSLGKFVVGTSPIMVLLSIIILFRLIIGVKKKGKVLFNIPEKWYISILLIGTTVLMFTSLYMQWTAYMADMVDGVQGRYFIPLIPAFAMLFMKEKEEIEKRKLIYMTLFMDALSVVAIFNTFI